MTTMGNENDFKFVMQNFSDIFFGLRLTYEELAEADDTPQKLKTAVYQYILSEAGENTRICDHVLKITKESKSYMVFSQLKGKFRIMFPVEITDRRGRTRTEYREKIYTIDQIVEDETVKAQINPEYIMEYKFSKLHLGALAV